MTNEEMTRMKKELHTCMRADYINEAGSMSIAILKFACIEKELLFRNFDIEEIIN